MVESLHENYIFVNHKLNLQSNGNSTANTIPFNANTKYGPLSVDDQRYEDILKEMRDKYISRYKLEIISVIQQDCYIDGEISRAEQFMQEVLENHHMDYVMEALMQLYYESILNIHILEGILVMIASVSYEAVEPKGQIMAIGLLTNKELEIRDRAIQCFERWNSKKGLSILKSLECHPKWLQKYVDNVISYIERDGIE